MEDDASYLKDDVTVEGKMEEWKRPGQALLFQTGAIRRNAIVDTFITTNLCFYSKLVRLKAYYTLL